MVLLREEFCVTCNKKTSFYNGKCGICKEREVREALQRWEAKPIEEKLRDLHLRLLKLEAGEVRF